MRIIIVSLLCVLLAGCTDTVIIKKNNPSTTQAVSAILARLEIAFQNQTEAEMVKQELYDFCYFLEIYYGEEKWRQFCQQVVVEDNPLESGAIAVYGKTMYHLGAELIRRALPEQSSGKPEPEKKVQGFFEIHCDDAKLFARDSAYIRYTFQAYESVLFKELLTTQETKDRFNKNLNYLSEKRIPVYLVSNKAHIAKVFKNPWSTAETSLGFWIKEPGKPGTLNASIAFKYSGLLTLNTVVHEMTHMFLSLSQLDLSEAAKVHPGDTKAVMQEKMAPLKEAFAEAGGNLILGEGMAEYMASKYNMLQKYGILNDVDETIRQYCSKTQFAPDAMELEKYLRTPESELRILGYQMAHSFTRYLLRRFGREKVMTLLHTKGGDEDYLKVVGQSKQAVLLDWQKTVFGSGKKLALQRP